ncbi:hypothetical protein CP500_006790 [Tychonema bourrellyi FEM_GT703]|uniref:Uncharacterized protein n=1 Tax=Tychonema bourrellyi FEM_GT703 TaxID=2040638 RepID=A0A2G4F379_9CYAN|nr:hypothetical protein CP500_006790 [Tychonema bourrellyi FEM_GT703]
MWQKCDRPKKIPAKIGRELINQGASTKLVSGISMPLSGLFRKFAKICGNRQDACSTKDKLSCGTGILPVHQKINCLVEQASCLFIKGLLKAQYSQKKTRPNLVGSYQSIRVHLPI